MIFPLYDENPTRRFPLVTMSIIALNIFIYIFEAGMDIVQLESFIRAFAFTPADFAASGNFTTIFTAMCLHGGLLHLAGNMLYLWIFGNNIEDMTGHIRFLLFYLASGVAGTLAHFLIEPSSTIPILGASGAIAGVLGAYIVLFPNAKVVSLVPIIFFVTLYRLPAILVIGLWFVIQFASGLGALQAAGGDGSSIAWFAHLGGFIFGMVVIGLIKRPDSRRRLRA